MKLDFAKTKRAVRDMLDESLSRFHREHPSVKIHKLCLWGYGFGKVAHVLLETSDDKAVFGGRYGEYNDNEFGRGVTFEWWPDLYSCAEGEPYEIELEDRSVVRTFQSEEGNDAIDRPLFELLKQVLRDADISSVNKGASFALAVEMGSSGLEETWN
jgi:hypothetical protein